MGGDELKYKSIGREVGRLYISEWEERGESLRARGGKWGWGWSVGRRAMYRR